MTAHRVGDVHPYSTQQAATDLYLQAFDMMRRRCGLVAALEWASAMVDHARAQGEADIARIEQATRDH